VDFTKGFMKEHRFVRRASVYLFSFTTLRKIIPSPVIMVSV
jgi:hypothetical protein